MRSITGLGLLGLTLAFLIAAAAILIDAMQEDDRDWRRGAQRENQNIIVDTDVIRHTRATPVLRVHGTVHSLQSAEVRAAVAGRVVEISSDLRSGAPVAAGQLIARLDPAQEIAAQTRLQLDLRDIEIEISDAANALEIAQAELESNLAAQVLRKSALLRQQNLAQRGSGLAGAFEDAELSLIAAEQTVLATRSRIAEAEARSALAATAKARKVSELEDAARALDATLITAPIDGTWGSEALVLGREVSAFEALGTIVGTWPLEIAMRVPSSAYARLTDAEGALLPLPVNLEWAGRTGEASMLAQLDRAGLAATDDGSVQAGRTLFARMFQADGVPVLPGDQVVGTITEPSLENVAILPAAALGPKNTLYVLRDNDTVEMLGVTVVRRQGDAVIVRNAPDGRRYVTKRLPGLTDGAAVTPRQGPETQVDGGTVTVPVPETQDHSTPSGKRAGEGDEQQLDDERRSMAGGKTISISPEERARLTAMVNANASLNDRARTRILTMLKSDEVPAGLVRRIEQEQ
ncbi:MAG: hypothetical protein AAF666_16625 [Pseudomonadota bacterium]